MNLSGAASGGLVFFVILNLLLNFARFHDFSGFTFLGKIRMPIMSSLICIAFAFTLLGNWTKQLKVVLFFLVVEVLRTIIGFLVLPDFVVNDGWQYNTLRDMSLNFFGMMLPITLGFKFRKNIEQLLTFFTFASLILSAWVISHGGRGPGGHIGDENDVCLVLVFLMPFSFCFFKVGKSFLKKIFGLSSGLVCLVAIVATSSRGGFLGLAVIVLLQFLLSKKKVKWILGAFISFLLVSPFIPKEYYEEVFSIGTELSAEKNEDSTIDERFRTWSMVIRMWKDPKNTFFGVGLENSKWNFKDYQDAGSGTTRNSLAGRSTHSTYFQVLGDLGVWGVLFFFVVIYITVKQLMLVSKSSKQAMNTFKLLASREKNEFTKLFNSINYDLNFINLISTSCIISWFGVFAAALGISVAYYPTLWLMISFSSVVFLYWTSLEKVIVKLKTLEALEPSV